MKILIGQLNLIVGDIEGNYEKIKKALSKKHGYDIAVFPELTLCGYPPLDLLFKKSFLRTEEQFTNKLMSEFPDIPIVIGGIVKKEIKPDNTFDITSINDKRFFLYNTAKLMYKGKIIDYQGKANLPHYDVFNEFRYFQPYDKVKVFLFLKEKKGFTIKPFIIVDNERLEDPKSNTILKRSDIENKYKAKTFNWIGISVCEDIWVKNSVPYVQGKWGADILINISASCFYYGKKDIRRHILQKISAKYDNDVVYVNMVGGQDCLIFEGESYHYQKGRPVNKARSFNEEIKVFDTTKRSSISSYSNKYEDIYNALTLAIKDYFEKNGFKKALIGLSGGIDSALVTVITADAIGRSNVKCLIMPSENTSPVSVKDAVKLCNNLNIDHSIIPINNIHDIYLSDMNRYMKFKKYSVTDQNIQSRIRGNLLMAYANNTGGIVVSCGNKSEFAVGYSTLYGDLAGGISPISDLYKTMVYRLANYINKKTGKSIIPRNIILKEPSAELRPDQKDSDDLPDYRTLDAILKFYIEDHYSLEDILKKGFSKSTVLKVIKMVDRNEYKRKQAPFGFKISPKSFGPGRLMPITQRFEQK